MMGESHLVCWVRQLGVKCLYSCYYVTWAVQPSARGYNSATLFLGGYKYGDLTLQVGGVSDETVKYGREFCGTSIQE
jgi:hypothetical protein